MNAPTPEFNTATNAAMDVSLKSTDAQITGQILRAKADALDCAGLSPQEMLDCAANLGENAGMVSVNTGFIEGLTDLIYFLPFDQLKALRAARVPKEIAA